MVVLHHWNKSHICNLSSACLNFESPAVTASKPHKLRSWPSINWKFVKRSVVSSFLITLWRTRILLSSCFRSWKLSVYLFWFPRRSRETEITDMTTALSTCFLTTASQISVLFLMLASDPHQCSSKTTLLYKSHYGVLIKDLIIDLNDGSIHSRRLELQGLPLLKLMVDSSVVSVSLFIA